MNYFLVLVILAICAGAFYQHTQDEQQIASLQQQLAELNGGEPVAKKNPESSNSDNSTTETSVPAAAPSAPVPVPGAPRVAVLPANTSHAPGIDAAAEAARAAENASGLGTITTLDGRSFQNCKVLKVQSDGITFSHADGITKVLFPLLRPEIQQKYGYDPKKAVAETAAEIRYQQEKTPVTAPAAATNPANP